MGMWSPSEAEALAAEVVSWMPRRWSHVRAVGQCAAALFESTGAVPESVVVAAWLHDVGYSPAAARTGFHPFDGAVFLAERGAPDEVVGLVAHHTGAQFEAEERGLLERWRELPAPDPAGLDLLTMIDLAVTPDGHPTVDIDRIAEILGRYGPDNPVHQAVERSRLLLLEASARGKARLGLPDDWPRVVG
jgi:putative nucleotidyltransferase with HDIG domain